MINDDVDHWSGAPCKPRGSLPRLPSLLFSPAWHSATKPIIEVWTINIIHKNSRDDSEKLSWCCIVERCGAAPCQGARSHLWFRRRRSVAPSSHRFAQVIVIIIVIVIVIIIVIVIVTLIINLWHYCESYIAGCYKKPRPWSDLIQLCSTGVFPNPHWVHGYCIKAGLSSTGCYMKTEVCLSGQCIKACVSPITMKLMKLNWD